MVIPDTDFELRIVVIDISADFFRQSEIERRTRNRTDFARWDTVGIGGGVRVAEQLQNMLGNLPAVEAF